MKQSWRALLLEIGCALVDSRDESYKLVLHVCPWGVLTWPLHAERAGGGIRFNMKPPPKGSRNWASWVFVGIDALDSLRCRSAPHRPEGRAAP